MLIGNIGIRDGGLIIRDIDDSEIAMPITDALTLLDWLQQHKPELEAEQAKLDDIASNLSAKSVAKSYEEIETEIQEIQEKIERQD
jgi:hypothetical protein